MALTNRHIRGGHVDPVVIVQWPGDVLRVTATDDEYAVARAGGNICYWLNDKVGVNGDTVLTDGPAGDQPGVYYNVAPGEQVFITQICYGLTTVSDSCTYELGWCDAVNGGGTFTPITLERHIATGASARGRQDEDLTITPPLGPLKYSSGVRSITFRVNANDAGASINVGWHGWRERES